MMEQRKKILAMLGYYPPARKSGGPAKSVSSMIGRLSDYDFYVYCWDTDIDGARLPGILTNQWQTRGGARVFYASRSRRSFLTILPIIRQVQPDALYVCSCFARLTSMQIFFLRRMGLLGPIPVILAPRGEFSQGALRLKRVRKRIFLDLSRWLGLHRSVVWHACSNEEVADIHRVQGPRARVVLAPNFPSAPDVDALDQHTPKRQNLARLVFLSRISPKKNLLGVMQALARVQQPVEFDIYGPIEDPGCWAQCRQIMERLPQNISVHYRGAVDPDRVGTVFRRYDATILLTWGENYGYVIVESWAAATPVLVSDRTPWKNLEADRAGWEAAPDAPDRTAQLIDTLARMDEAEHAQWREGALLRANALFSDGSLEPAYDLLFHEALEPGRA